jgi:hypothetical protein
MYQQARYEKATATGPAAPCPDFIDKGLLVWCDSEEKAKMRAKRDWSEISSSFPSLPHQVLEGIVNQ